MIYDTTYFIKNVSINKKNLMKNAIKLLHITVISQTVLKVKIVFSTYTYSKETKYLLLLISKIKMKIAIL